MSPTTLSLPTFYSFDPLLLSLQDLAQAFGSAWTSRWFRWAGTMLRPSACGRARDCLRRRSGSGLHVGGCKVHSLYTEIMYLPPLWLTFFLPFWQIVFVYSWLTSIKQLGLCLIYIDASGQSASWRKQLFRTFFDWGWICPELQFRFHKEKCQELNKKQN